MPGIAGIISQAFIGDGESCVASMLETMRHEKFYKSGTYSCPTYGIYAGWVAHEGSFAAGQVFYNENREIALLLSGECFLDPAVVSELSGKGHRLDDKRGGCLPHLYEERGSRFWEELNGLFSGLLIDKRQGKAFLFNDRYGT